MKNSHIVIIDKNVQNIFQLIDVLEIKYGEKNIHLFNTFQDGLYYLMNNLNQRMVVLLDISFSETEENGYSILKELWGKTELIPVIIWTANKCSQSQIIDLLNNHIYAFVRKNDSIEKIVLALEQAIQSTSSNIDVALEQWLEKQDNKDSLMLVSKSGMSYTANQLLEEIRKQTDEGKSLVNNINKLTIDLLFRGKEKI